MGQYVSIEKAIADTKESYYKALADADRGWHAGENDPRPFIRYMLAVILSCYRDFENRVAVTDPAGARSTAYDLVKACVNRKIGTFTKQEILQECPRAGKSSVESALKQLTSEGHIVKLGAGRATRYVRNGES